MTITEISHKMGAPLWLARLAIKNAFLTVNKFGELTDNDYQRFTDLYGGGRWLPYTEIEFNYNLTVSESNDLKRILLKYKINDFKQWISPVGQNAIKNRFGEIDRDFSYTQHPKISICYLSENEKRFIARLMASSETTRPNRIEKEIIKNICRQLKINPEILPFV